MSTHAQLLLVCSNEVDALRARLKISQTKADVAEYKRNKAKTRFQQLRSSLQRQRATVSLVQKETAGSGTASVHDHKYLVGRHEHSNDHMFSDLVKKLLEEGRQTKIDIYKESQMTVNIYDDGWQSHLNALSKPVEDVATPADAVQAAFDVLLALAVEAHAGSGSHSCTGDIFQFDAEPESPRAGLDQNPFY